MKQDVYAIGLDGTLTGLECVEWVFDPRSRVGYIYKGDSTIYVNFDHFTQITVMPSEEQPE